MAAGTCAPRHDRSPHARIHPTAAIGDGVHIGAGTTIWDHVHVRGPASIGSDCIIGEKTYVAYGVSIGNYVKINARVYICTGITIEDRVLIAAGVIFTNERYPRAFADGVVGLATSEPTDATLTSTVRTGATIGAGTVLGPGIVVGPYAMVGMGSVLTASVPAHGLAYGNPARLVGCVCTCGVPLYGSRGRPALAEHDDPLTCTKCGRRFTFSGWTGPSERALVETES
jgi:acetyltransferase-like isoleucine patch superfamily enzyme